MSYILNILRLFSDVGALVCKYDNCNERFRHENLLKQHVSDAHLSKDTQEKDLNVEAFSGETTSTKEQNIFFGHSDKYVNGLNNGMDLNIPDSLMPEVLNDVCNEVTIYTDF